MDVNFRKQQDLADATAAFNRDAGPMAQAGWQPTSQVYAPGQWSGGQFLVDLLLCLVLVGILIFIYMIVVKPAGSLVVTYEYRGAEGTAPLPPFDPYGKAPPGYRCGKCSKPVSPAWKGKCEHCGTRYTEVMPVART
jgi:hypothetical protein